MPYGSRGDGGGSGGVNWRGVVHPRPLIKADLFRPLQQRLSPWALLLLLLLLLLILLPLLLLLLAAIPPSPSRRSRNIGGRRPGRTRRRRRRRRGRARGGELGRGGGVHPLRPRLEPPLLRRLQQRLSSRPVLLAEGWGRRRRRRHRRRPQNSDSTRSGRGGGISGPGNLRGVTISGGGIARPRPRMHSFFLLRRLQQGLPPGGG